MCSPTKVSDVVEDSNDLDEVNDILDEWFANEEEEEAEEGKITEIGTD